MWTTQGHRLRARPCEVPVSRELLPQRCRTPGLLLVDGEAAGAPPGSVLGRQPAPGVVSRLTWRTHGATRLLLCTPCHQGARHAAAERLFTSL